MLVCVCVCVCVSVCVCVLVCVCVCDMICMNFNEVIWSNGCCVGQSFFDFV